MNARRWIPLIVLAAIGVQASAQDRPLYRPSTDAELWLSTAIEVKPFQKKSGQVYERRFYRKFRTTGELGYRGNENLTSSKVFYTVVGLRYRFNKYLRLGIEHRYNFRDKYTDNTHRLDLQANASCGIGRAELGYRFVYQHEFTIPIRIRDIVRNRLQLSWRTPKFPIDPYMGAETFTALHYTGDQLIGLRYDVGAEWQLDKKHSVDVSVRHDREQNLKDLQYRWIFAVAYEFSYKR